MKKKIISALLCVSMVATMVAGCGGSSDTTSADNSNSGAAAPATESGSDAAETDTTGDEGKVFNIYCWNDCLLYTSPSPRDGLLSRMPSSA